MRTPSFLLEEYLTFYDCTGIIVLDLCLLIKRIYFEKVHQDYVHDFDIFRLFL